MLSGFHRSGVEEALDTSDLPWTWVQPVEFTANALEWVPAVLHREVDLERPHDLPPRPAGGAHHGKSRRDLGDQRGLADARLARHQHQATTTARGGVDGLAQLGNGTGSTDQHLFFLQAG